MPWHHYTTTINNSTQTTLRLTNIDQWHPLHISLMNAKSVFTFTIHCADILHALGTCQIGKLLAIPLIPIYAKLVVLTNANRTMVLQTKNLYIANYTSELLIIMWNYFNQCFCYFLSYYMKPSQYTAKIIQVTSTIILVIRLHAYLLCTWHVTNFKGRFQ